jgi:ATP-dependent Clp protease protease subunit
MTSRKEDSKLEILKHHLDTNLDHGIDFENRIIRVTGSIGDCSSPLTGGGEDYFDFNLLDIAMTKMETESTALPITIKVNSEGGLVYEAFAMIGRIKNSPCTIITEGYGCVMSAATLILMAGDIRKLSRFCCTMFHAMQYGTNGAHDDIKEHVAQAEKEMKQLAKYYEEFSTQNASFWTRKIKKKEYYPTAEEMLSHGAIDEVI